MTPASDPLGDLERLRELRDSGMLTREEFEDQKARILGRSTPASAEAGAASVPQSDSETPKGEGMETGEPGPAPRREPNAGPEEQDPGSAPKPRRSRRRLGLVSASFIAVAVVAAVVALVATGSGGNHITSVTVVSTGAVHSSPTTGPSPSGISSSTPTSLTGSFGTSSRGHTADVTVSDDEHPDGDPSATGTVTVRADGPQGQIIGSGTVIAGHMHLVLAPGDPGEESVAAYYAGDATHAASSTCLLAGSDGSPCP